MAVKSSTNYHLLFFRLRWLFETGHTQQWVQSHMKKWSQLAEKSQSLVSARNMALEDIGAIFYICLIGLGFAAAVFILEWFAGSATLRSRKLLREQVIQRSRFYHEAW